MAWVRVDDKFPRGRKVKRAARILGGKRARARVLAVWLDAMAYCNLHETDGFFADEELGELPDAAPDEVFEAMAAGDADLGPIVERDAARGGWQFRNYAEYQPTKASIEEERRKAAERKKAWRDAKRGHAVPEMSHGTTGDVPPVSHFPIRSVPIRPVPTDPTGEVQTNTEVQRVPRFVEFEAVTEHLKAAAYARLAEHPEADDSDLCEAVKQAAGALRVADYTGRKVTAIVNSVRGYLASQEGRTA